MRNRIDVSKRGSTDFSVPVKCAHCGWKTEFNCSNLQPGKEIQCKKCTGVIRISGDDVSNIPKKLDEMFNKIEKMFK